MTSFGLQRPLRQATKDAEGGTLSSNKVAALGEVEDIASLSTDCLMEALSSSDDDDFTWESLEPSQCPRFCRAWIRLRRRMELLLRIGEAHGRGCHTVQPKWTSRARPRWGKTKTGRRRARGVG
eukprot:651424-Amphidinium_carterae.2